MLPRLYAIIDSELCSQRGLSPIDHARVLISAGCMLLQYRNKSGSARQMLADSLAIRSLAPPHIKLIMNDRADLCLAASFDGVHLGQDDLSAASARQVCPAPMIVGVSTHNMHQVEAADRSSADYIAIGPIFSTSSKVNPDPDVGIDGVRAARKLTEKPLVAIGGITIENCRAIIDAGADSVAIISALLPPVGGPSDEPSISKRVGAFLRVLG